MAKYWVNAVLDFEDQVPWFRVQVFSVSTGKRLAETLFKGASAATKREVQIVFDLEEETPVTVVLVTPYMANGSLPVQPLELRPDVDK